jgi:hypothetical protein
VGSVGTVWAEVSGVAAVVAGESLRKSTNRLKAKMSKPPTPRLKSLSMDPFFLPGSEDASVSDQENIPSLRVQFDSALFIVTSNVDTIILGRFG